MASQPLFSGELVAGAASRTPGTACSRSRAESTYAPIAAGVEYDGPDNVTRSDHEKG